MREEEVKPSEIIFENDDILVLNKPAGVVVNDSESTGRETLQSIISKSFSFETSRLRDFRSGIVHRLDKETSGVILVAKSKAFFEKLQKEFFDRKVEKRYIALVHGELAENEGVINKPIGRLPKNRRKFGIIEEGREAETHYKVLKVYLKDGEKLSLVELTPKTGRTHQIRVHLKSLGHPIVSDPLYVGRKTLRSDKKWCPRLFLHATELKIFGNTYKSNLSDDLEKVLQSL
ncbi:MAG: RluA family pseudouridine synthase [Candidatus Woesebacteria bacterium]|nr:MAG: RluA family pseudouridine synthase [Candidatus Woesebacteria bacterium]